MEFVSVRKGSRRIGAALVSMALAAGCAPGQSPPEDAPPPAAGDGPAAPVVAPPPNPPAAPPPAPPQPRASESVRLVLVSQRRIGQNEFPPPGLTGANKPGGPTERFRTGVANGTPSSVPPMDQGMELVSTDRVDGGWLALYRTPLGQWPGGAWNNHRFRAILFSPDGSERRWTIDLDRFFTRPDHLEVQDVRYADGKLYFNEACQTYSADAGRRCSSLVRLDAASGSVDWRTPPLVSNNLFILHGPYVIAGYGFTREDDFVHVVDRATGRVLHRTRVDSMPTYLEVKDGRLYVLTYNHTLYEFRIEE
jgi:hypothetical protein